MAESTKFEALEPDFHSETGPFFDLVSEWSAEFKATVPDNISGPQSAEAASSGLDVELQPNFHSINTETGPLFNLASAWAALPTELQAAVLEKLPSRRRREPSSSNFDVARAWAELPTEQKAAVLGKLPLRQLTQARRVCRQWQAIIEDVCHLGAGVRRVSLEQWRLWTSTDKDPEDRHHHHQFRVGPAVAATIQACRTLDFLAPRSPLTSLEIGHLACFNNNGPRLFKRLLETDLVSMEKLRSLTVYHLAFDSFPSPFPVFYASITLLAKLIQKQKKLEQLVLGAFLVSGHAHKVPAPLLWETEWLESLRILALFATEEMEFKCIPAATLARLDCFSFSYCWEGSKAAMKRAAAGKYAYVRASAPGLRLREHVLRERCSRILWAKEGFQVDKAMKDKSLHSRDFLSSKWPIPRN